MKEEDKNKKSKTGLIVGIVIVSLVCTPLIITLIVFMVKRRRKRALMDSTSLISVTRNKLENAKQTVSNYKDGIIGNMKKDYEAKKNFGRKLWKGVKNAWSDAKKSCDIDRSQIKGPGKDYIGNIGLATGVGLTGTAVGIPVFSTAASTVGSLASGVGSAAISNAGTLAKMGLGAAAYKVLTKPNPKPTIGKVSRLSTSSSLST